MLTFFSDLHHGPTGAFLGPHLLRSVDAAGDAVGELLKACGRRGFTCPQPTATWRFSCAFSLPAPAAGSAPPSFPSSSARAIRSSGSHAQMTQPRPSRPLARRVQSGTLDDLTGLHAGAEASDGVIHLAFKHDIAFSGDFQGAVDADRRAIDALGDALAGSNRPFTIASGLLGLAPGQGVTEPGWEQPRPRRNVAGWRCRDPVGQCTADALPRLPRRPFVRLPPTVHGEGDNGFLATLVTIARAKGLSAYIGDGSNRWPAVPRLDAAPLFRLAWRTLRQVDAARGRRRGRADPRDRRADRAPSRRAAVASISPEDAGPHFTWLAGFLALDSPASSVGTRKLLGRQPTHPGLLDDLDQGHYFHPSE